MPKIERIVFKTVGELRAYIKDLPDDTKLVMQDGDLLHVCSCSFQKTNGWISQYNPAVEGRRYTILPKLQEVVSKRKPKNAKILDSQEHTFLYIKPFDEVITEEYTEPIEKIFIPPHVDENGAKFPDRLADGRPDKKDQL